MKAVGCASSADFSGADGRETAGALAHRGRAMPKNPSRTGIKNRILSHCRARILRCSNRTWCPSTFLSRPSWRPGISRIDNVYFIERGFASVVADGSGKRGIEVGIIGREGMTGLAVVMGHDRSAHDTYIQVEGAGQRIGAGKLRRAMDQSVRLHRSLLRYVHTFLIQTAQTALANGRSKNTERLARWLLMADDRIDRRRAAPHAQVSWHHAWRAAARRDPRGAGPRAGRSHQRRTRRHHHRRQEGVGDDV